MLPSLRRAPTRLPSRQPRVRFLLSAALPFLVAVLLLSSTPHVKGSASHLYPDLRTLPAKDLRLGQETIDGVAHHVLRFTTTIWNAGQGALELRGVSSGDTTWVYQRLYQDSGSFVEHPVGEFIYHETHNHWHLENFARYELWTRAEYEGWLSTARGQGEPRWLGSKTTGGESFCIRDSYEVQKLPATPSSRTYTECDRELQGISVGWGDNYSYNLPNQWVDLGELGIPSGEYVLRLVADPSNLLYESPDKEDDGRESSAANEAVSFIRITAPSP